MIVGNLLPRLANFNKENRIIVFIFNIIHMSINALNTETHLFYVLHPEDMKKGMSSFDVASMVKEMATLEGGHMDKIFQWDSGTVLFRINISGDGKKDLFFKDGEWLYLPSVKPETPMNPLSFATYLRKKLDNARIGKTRQHGFDRIIIMDVMKADAEYQLIFELFGGGNILLVLNGVIENCLIHRTMRDRTVRPGEQYLLPKVRFDPVTSSKEEFMDCFSSSSDTVRTLATVAGLGGLYAEEVCFDASIDKKIPALDLSIDDKNKLWNSLKSIVSRIFDSPSPTVYGKEGNVDDVCPIDMKVYDGYEKTVYSTLSSAIEYLMTQISKNKEKEYVDPELDKLGRRIERQRITIEEYKQDAESLRLKADSIYSNYQQVNELLTVMFQQSKKLNWDKLTEGAMKIPFVTSVNPSKNTVVAMFDGIDIPLDYTMGLDANASEIYRKGKEIGEKATRAEEALNESIAAYEKRKKGLIKAEISKLSRAQPTKQFWFERYKWFITSGGKLVIAGKDAHTNDNIVKKHLKDLDVYAHADVHGAPSVILKDGQKATSDELREACHFAIAQSKGWVAALSDGGAFWVYPDQVSKTPEAGEFVPRGAFIIRGKRNYEYHLPIKLAVGEIFYQKERKIMCGPENVVSKQSSKYFVIVPGKGKAGKTSATMAKEFNVPEEEVSRILPPGDSEIVSKVWPEITQE